jgi:hypothetical protein
MDMWTAKMDFMWYDIEFFLGGRRFLVTPCRPYTGSGGKAPFIISAPDGSECSTSYSAALPQRKNPDTHRIGSWVGNRVGLDVVRVVTLACAGIRTPALSAGCVVTIRTALSRLPLNIEYRVAYYVGKFVSSVTQVGKLPRQHYVYSPKYKLPRSFANWRSLEFHVGSSHADVLYGS